MRKNQNENNRTNTSLLMGANAAFTYYVFKHIMCTHFTLKKQARYFRSKSENISNMNVLQMQNYSIIYILPHVIKKTVR